MSDSAADGRVSLAIEGTTAHITFDRPAARNAMTWTMYEDLKQACASIAANDSVRVAVLRGAGGKAFVAGTDISQFQSFESGADGIDYERRISEYVGAVASLPVPTIAVVEGCAVGGGMAIASVCDFRLATPGSALRRTNLSHARKLPVTSQCARAGSNGRRSDRQTDVAAGRDGASRRTHR